MTSPSQMFVEAAQSASVVRAQISANAALMADVGARLRRIDPPIVFTCARGSSDHAATFAKYLFETRLGVPTSSQALSISSVYGAPLRHMADKPFILISQSGRSPDLIACAKAARLAGALVIAIVNDMASPLADIAEIVVPVHAGAEVSVAATKSYVATLSAIVHLAAAWGQDAALADALAALPDMLDAAWEADWAGADEVLIPARSLFVLGRGMTLGIAQEAALKCKETAGIHAEAFSAAEVAHGPMALVGAGFPVLIFPPIDRAVAGIARTVAAFAARGAVVASVGTAFDGALTLPMPRRADPVTAPIAMAFRFYRLIDAVARARGYDPDHPPLLNKVTQTL